ncbi:MULTISPECIES: hypothetical protein [Micromonospora]|uniref:Uncharacterized protein n=1 Tax=Micromonospora sicca TaxID=2202420 RepID=A0A317DSA0_9ACTN|nr:MULTISPECIES: hypothetical protein [unclassified Micromonospora]MBM0227900.1 hypothetical protein [Micromonospora sp. ATA51]MDZ5442870.1 hypothetical protein [Micromonospora sp. 4G57]MDZ5492282.1 hypothetical protein [Micromonospora sp. 4G53]PWR16940.1 hypothetical protein DKT69_02935 [Micromonospora sp. 4G51]
MTRAPANLLAVRTLLLSHLNVDPNVVRPEDLEPAEVGIVGDPSHRGGYHCGSDRVVANDYSVVESSRDSSGLTLDAAALDVGTFQVSAGGRAHNLYTFSTWCVAECVAGAPDTGDLREIIYSPDGAVVRRWDRLGKRSTGDSSHLFHTHFSFFRDSIKANRDQTPLFRRYLTSIGLLEDDMSAAAESQIANLYSAMFYGGPSMGRSVDPDGSGPQSASNSVVAKLDYLMLRVDALGVALTNLANRDFTNEEAIIAGVLAGLTPEKIAAALPPTIAKDVADEMARRLAA